MTYCTLAQVREYGKFRTSETDSNTLITNLIGRVQASFESQTGRIFASGADSTVVVPEALLDRDGRDLLIYADLCQLTSVAIGGDVLSGSAYHLLTWGGARLWSAGNRVDVIRLKELDWSGDVTIVGRWAYSITPPLDVVQACIEWTFHEYKRATSLTTNGAPTTTLDGKLVMPNAMPASVRDVIERYQRVGVV